MSKLNVTPPPIIFGFGFLIGGLIHLLYAPPLPYRAILQGIGRVLTGVSFSCFGAISPRKDDL